jgi:hypothetical protein
MAEPTGHVGPSRRALALVLAAFLAGAAAIAVTVVSALVLATGSPPPRLTVEVAPGWSAADRAVFERIAEVVYPIIVDVTGPPAAERTIVIHGGASGGGCSAADGIAVSRGGPLDAWLAECVTHEIVHSFHDHAGLPDGLEEGATVATTALVLSRADEALGLDPIAAEPAQVTLGGVAMSSSAGADLVDDPSLAADPWVAAHGAFPPGATDMYGVAGAFWMALLAERPTVLRDFYGRWHAAVGPLRPTPDELLRALVPSVGGIPFDEWRSGGWWAVRTGHDPGMSVRCADLSPQLDRVPGGGNARSFYGLVRLISTDTTGRIEALDGVATVRIRSADGSPTRATAYPLGDTTGVEPGERLPAPASPGAYRLTFSVTLGRTVVDAGSCWLTAGVRGTGHVLVVGRPGLEVAVAYPAPWHGGPDGGTVHRRVRIPGNGIAVLGPAGTGLVVVSTADGLRKAVPIGPAGAEVAVSEP